MLPTITALQAALDQGETTSVALTQAALARIADPGGEGARTFTTVWAEQALAEAQASDTLRAAGQVRSPLDGLPVSIKDLFDVAGQVTRAGSRVRENAAPAARHADPVQRLARAGAVLIGHTNMTEFAFSGLGINPHYGTPSSPWDRASRRIPGGSSSGAGVSVADGMAVAALGTDTGGSIRIPSAFCGLTGFKPTASRVPSGGTFPLATSLDSVGPLAASVECCAILDGILSGDEARRPPAAPPLARLRLAVANTLVLDGADDTVRDTFAAAIARLRAAGIVIDTLDIPAFEALAHINRKGGLVCAEAYAVHRDLLEGKIDRYDPRVSSRILRGRDIDAADYIELHALRTRWIAAVEARLQGYDALLLPTVPVVAPTIESLQASDEAYFAANGLILRNPTLINFLDGCALSLPCHTTGEAPVGLMVAGPAHTDARILDVGLAIEQILGAR
ncbi:amidase [Castellaniella sp.]|uniref:amidase n=1 Tax=Castellaniella sp. TaxID=1955812 RepID=UPI002AFE23F9|nr:amidase [Castellaniella sp.]